MNPLICGVFIISLAPILIHISPFTSDETAFYRMALGALFFWTLTLFKKGESLSHREKLLAMVGGAAFAIDLMCWHRSIHYIGPGVATLIANLQVLMVAGVSVFLPGPKPRPVFWLAAGIALTGLGLLAGQGAQEHLFKGIGLGLLAAVGYTAYLLSIKHIPQPDMAKTFQVMKWVSGSATFCLIAMLLRQSHVALPQTGSELMIVLLYGVLVQGVAWALIAMAMKKMRPFRVSLVLLLQPVLAMVWEVLFFERVLQATEIQGMLLVFVGIMGSFMATSESGVQKWVGFKGRFLGYTKTKTS